MVTFLHLQGIILILNPLVKINESYEKGILPKNIFIKIKERYRIVTSGIERIEHSAGIKYPTIYVEPSLIISNDTDKSNYAILFARTIPFVYEDKFTVLIQISAPLVVYGLKGTIHAILAHEFLHYLDLMNKISKNKIISDEVSGNIFENVYSDATKLFKPKTVFNDRTLIKHISTRFAPQFSDSKLENKIIESWLKKKLPKTIIDLDYNNIKLSMKSLAKFELQPELLTKINEIEKKTRIHDK